MSAEFNTSHDMIALARRNLNHDTWDYICGGAESETSLRRNRMAGVLAGRVSTDSGWRIQQLRLRRNLVFQ